MATAAAGPVLLIANLLYVLLRDRFDRSILAASIAVAAMPAIYLIIKAALRFADNDAPRWVLPKVDTDRMLILRAAADEASAALGAATLVSSMMTKLWSLTSVGAPLWIPALERDKANAALQRRYSWPRRIHALFVVGLFVLGIVLWILTTIQIGTPRVTSRLAGGALVASYLLGLVFAWRKALAIAVLAPLWWLSMLLVGPLLLLLSLFAMFFGPSLALRQLLWTVSAEPTPPGVWMTVQLDPELTPRGYRGLMHSSLYNDPRAHSVIAHWIEKTDQHPN